MRGEGGREVGGGRTGGRGGGRGSFSLIQSSEACQYLACTAEETVYYMIPCLSCRRFDAVVTIMIRRKSPVSRPHFVGLVYCIS